MQPSLVSSWTSMSQRTTCLVCLTDVRFPTTWSAEVLSTWTGPLNWKKAVRASTLSSCFSNLLPPSRSGPPPQCSLHGGLRYPSSGSPLEGIRSIRSISPPGDGRRSRFAGVVVFSPVGIQERRVFECTLNSYISDVDGTREFAKNILCRQHVRFRLGSCLLSKNVLNVLLGGLRLVRLITRYRFATLLVRRTQRNLIPLLQ